MRDVDYYIEKNKYLTKQNFTPEGDHHNAFITVTIMFGFVGLFFIIMLFISILRLKFDSTFYKSLNVGFIISYTLWCMTGNNFHGMNPMTFFAFFVGLFNFVSNIQNTKTK